MPKNNNPIVKEIDDDEYNDDDFTDSDYGFIINADGTLKTMWLPEDLMEDPPKSVMKLLKIFGIKDIHSLEPKTLH